MSKRGKILWITFSLFFLVTTLELVYFIFYDSISPFIKLPIPPSTSTNDQKTTPPPPSKIDSPATQTTSDIQTDENQAISEDVIKQLRIPRKDMTKLAIFVVRLEGTIIEVEEEEGTTDWGYKYQATLKARGEQGGVTTLIFNQQELDILKVYKKGALGEDQPISFNDLTVGDYITIKALFDLIRGTERFQVESITVLR